MDGVKTKRMWAIMEEAAEKSLTSCKRRYPDRAAQDQFYSHVLGEIDGRAAVETSKIFAANQSVLRLLNTTYQDKATTNDL